MIILKRSAFGLGKKKAAAAAAAAVFVVIGLVGCREKKVAVQFRSMRAPRTVL